MSNAMELSEESLQTIGNYVRRNLPEWVQEIDVQARHEWELRLTERIVRVEDELRTRRELMQNGFERVDTRFEHVDKQMQNGFEQVEKRFEQVDTRFEHVDKQMQNGFAQVDKRFEQVDKRFEQMEKRFEHMEKQFERSTRHISLWLALITVLMMLVGSMGAWGTFFA
ncbi:MAG: hypothetical protein PF508_18590 [Spirochaeta sp.]|jgi:archaellum component FlaC|nr:hypothetical protein [Spirochaeta sp.]